MGLSSEWLVTSGKQHHLPETKQTSQGEQDAVEDEVFSYKEGWTHRDKEQHKETALWEACSPPDQQAGASLAKHLLRCPVLWYCLIHPSKHPHRNVNFFTDAEFRLRNI